MRLSTPHCEVIRRIVREEAGNEAVVRLFGSRLDDEARGGDVDLYIASPRPLEHPAWLAARIGARLSRAFDGRRVDVLLGAPNLLRQPIHEQAEATGVLL